MKHLFASVIGVMLIGIGPALALDELASVQGPDIARAEAAIRVLPTAERAQAQQFLDRSSDMIQDGHDGGGSSSAALSYNRAVAVLSQWQASNGVAMVE